MGIRFGTDGWRAVIGEDFIPENVAQVIQAFADRYPKLPEAGRVVIIGYDRRRQSKESAELAASILLANNIPVYLASDFCPTPCVSWWVVRRKAAAGIMITASHNPPGWNGIKFKESYGGAASAAFLNPIERQIDQNRQSGRKAKTAALKKHPHLYRFDPHREYIIALCSLVNLEKIQNTGDRILYDALYGAGSGFMQDLLGNQVETLHGNADPDFGGLHPEPIQPYVNEAMEKMRSGKYAVCLINDGDADRIGAVDEKGNYVSAHIIFALLLQHLVENRQMTGKVLKSISTTVMIDRLCRKYHLPCEVTKVGFKYLSPAMKERGVLIGGEESGGIGMPHHICERDGLYCGLLLLELMERNGKRLGALIADLQKHYGPCYYRRGDLSLPKEQIEKAKGKLANYEPESLAGQKLKKRNFIDGFHYTLADDSWLLIRPSGTEPLLRTYAEAPSTDQVDALLKEARALVS